MKPLTWSLFAALALIFAMQSSDAPAADPAGQYGAGVAAVPSVLADSGVRGGVIVYIEYPDAELPIALAKSGPFKVLALSRSATTVAQAREKAIELPEYGELSFDRFDGQHIPMIDNSVNLILVDGNSLVDQAELLRALCPNGVAMIRQGEQWQKIVKPRPDDIDDWQQYLHDGSNNAVAHDDVVGPPRRLQWVAGPRFSRHHDRISSVNAMVSAGGRVFYVNDESTRISALTPPQWMLVARDAFNGSLLWQREITPGGIEAATSQGDKWYSHMWPLKSGPAQLPRRLVSDDQYVYATLGYDAPLTVLDAATGKTVKSCDETIGTDEILMQGDTLFLLINGPAASTNTKDPKAIKSGYGREFHTLEPRTIMALEKNTWKPLWTATSPVLPVTMAADTRHVVFHDGYSVICLDRATGNELWRSEPVARSEKLLGYFAPTLVLVDGVVVFAGGEAAGNQTGSWSRVDDSMTGIDAATGAVLWTVPHPASGYRSAEDVIVVDGLVWSGETTSGRAEGNFTGRDLHTGEVVKEFVPDVDTYWFHHRCYRAKATDKYLLMSRTGVEFIDLKDDDYHWDINHWVRGACLYGIMPANGLLYAPQHPCACYLEAKLDGFNALAPAAAGPRIPESLVNAPRLEKGPAYEEAQRSSPDGMSLAGMEMALQQWPTYRHDAARSGRASCTVPTKPVSQWETQLGGKLTPPVIADGSVYVAAVDQHTLYCLNAETGAERWHNTVGGRIDSPPTIYDHKVYFGSVDGHVYCLNASDGVLVWRFRAAKIDQRLVSFGQLESAWPVHGNILVQNNELWFAAGRSMFLDEGVSLFRLDPRTGAVITENAMDEVEDDTGRNIQDFVSWLNMPPALPDILSSDGRYVYMRSQPYRLDGTRLPLESMGMFAGNPDQGAPVPEQNSEFSHVFSPTGFLDDSWWHRTYWLYGSRFVSGWCGYYLAGKAAPAGKIMAFDDDNVYSFGREPKFYRWTVPIEHVLFSASRTLPELTPDYQKSPQAAKYAVQRIWSSPLPIFARAMVLDKEGMILVAGPEDVVDETVAFQMFGSPEIDKVLVQQAKNFTGSEGGQLFAVSTSTGKIHDGVELDSIPVFDGMAAADGKLFMSTVDGKIRCFTNSQPPLK